jgi:hypothetical protein
MYWDIAADAPPGHPSFIQMPICSTVNGKLRFFYIGWLVYPQCAAIFSAATPAQAQLNAGPDGSAIR